MSLLGSSFPHAIAVAFVAVLAPASALAQLNIIPLGDSITYGATANGVAPGGYQGYLYSDLASQNIGVNYVGAANGNPSQVLTSSGQTGSDGFGGYTIDEIRANLTGSQAPHAGQPNAGGYWLTGGGGTGRPAESANVILLLIGTNDFSEQYDPLYNPTNVQGGTQYPYEGAYEDNNVFAAHAVGRLQLLLNDLITLEPNATILVGSTLPFYRDPRVAVYNNGVKNLIATSFSTQKVDFVDFYNKFNWPLYDGYLNPNYDSGDGIHPNALGYSVLAQYWDAAILANVAVPEPSTLGTVITSLLGLLLWGGWRTRSRRSVEFLS